MFYIKGLVFLRLKDLYKSKSSDKKLFEMYYNNFVKIINEEVVPFENEEVILY